MSRTASDLPRTPAAARALTVAAGLVAIPQAFVLATAVAAVAEGRIAGAAAVAGPAALFLALGALRALLDAAAARTAGVAASRAKAGVRAAVARRAARFSPADAERPAAGEIAALAGEQAESLDPFLNRYALARTRLSVLPAAIALAVAWNAWAAAAILVVAFPFIPIFSSLIGAEARDRSAAQLAEVGTFTGVLLDKLSGLRTLRLFGAVERTAGDVDAAGDGIRRRTMSVLKLAFLSSAVIEIFSAVGIALVAVFVGFNLLGWIDFGAGPGGLDLASGLFVLLLAPDFFQPLRDFSAAYHDKAAADAFAARRADLLDAPRPAILGAGATAAAAAPAAPAVRIESLTVAAPDGRIMVAGVSLEVAAGEHVALFGPSGAGKSTLIAAVAGLVRPAEGAVRIDGVPLDDDAADALRARMAFVGQAPLTRPGTLRANLSLADPADPAAAAAALRSAGLEAFVRALPHGLATPLGEAGAGLSGGELRRLAVARALLADRPLILADEPTADLDADTAEAVRRGLKAAARGRTLVVATHDPALARLMDRIIPVAPPAAADTAAGEPAVPAAADTAVAPPAAGEPETCAAPAAPDTPAAPPAAVRLEAPAAPAASDRPVPPNSAGPAPSENPAAPARSTSAARTEASG